MSDTKEIIVGLIVGALIFAFCVFVVIGAERECARKTCPAPFTPKHVSTEVGCMCVVEPK